jgi:Flp pilus assembly pilin Flp
MAYITFRNTNILGGRVSSMRQNVANGKRATLGGNQNSSGGLPFFEDSFAGGQVNPSNGVTYSTAEGGLDQSEVVAASGEGLSDTDGATWLLRTRYLATALGESGGNGQVNLSLGRECNEFWVEWRYFCPANYAHRNDIGTDNNKFIIAYKTPYSSGTHQVGCELELGTAPVISIIRPMMRFTTNQNGATAGTYTRIEAGVTTAIVGASNPIVPGTWNTIRWYTRKSSTLGTADGIWRMWVNGTLLREFTGLHMGASDPAKFAGGLDAVYLFGVANSGYDNDTTFYTRYIKFYDTNPGWA